MAEEAAKYLLPDEVHGLLRVHLLVRGKDTVQEWAGLQARGSARRLTNPCPSHPWGPPQWSPKLGPEGVNGGIQGQTLSCAKGPVPPSPEKDRARVGMGRGRGGALTVKFRNLPLSLATSGSTSGR